VLEGMVRFWLICHLVAACDLCRSKTGKWVQGGTGDS
jgi:hypothetical protein